jgi:hypothetical protein
MQNVQALQSPASCEFESTNALSVIEFDVFRALKNLSTSKASVGWYSQLDVTRICRNTVLAYQITSILNRSFTEQKLPHSWKLADIVPIPKQQLIEDISKHLPQFHSLLPFPNWQKNLLL